MSRNVPERFATRLSDWLASSVLRVLLPVCPCVGVFLQIPRAQHTRLVIDILARMSRGCYEENWSCGTPAIYNKSTFVQSSVPIRARATGNTGPLPRCLSNDATLVTVQLDLTMSSTSSTGPWSSFSCSLILNTPSRFLQRW